MKEERAPPFPSACLSLSTLLLLHLLLLVPHTHHLLNPVHDCCRQSFYASKPSALSLFLPSSFPSLFLSFLRFSFDSSSREFQEESNKRKGKKDLALEYSSTITSIPLIASLGTLVILFPCFKYRFCPLLVCDRNPSYLSSIVRSFVLKLLNKAHTLCRHTKPGEPLKC